MPLDFGPNHDQEEHYEVDQELLDHHPTQEHLESKQFVFCICLDHSMHIAKAKIKHYLHQSSPVANGIRADRYLREQIE
jgi:hypothetical protein